MHIGSFRAGGATPLSTASRWNESDFCGHQSIRHSGARSLFGHNEHSEGRKRKDSIANGFSDSGSVTVE
jgi:hypothetical protein